MPGCGMLMAMGDATAAARAEARSATTGEARSAIADLVHGYALHIRRRESVAASALFAADARFEVRVADPRAPHSFAVMSRAEGREAVGEFIAQATARALLLPMIHNLIITLAQDGKTACASSLMVAREWPGGSEVIGEYADSFVRAGENWRFTERIYTVFAPA